VRTTENMSASTFRSWKATTCAKQLPISSPGWMAPLSMPPYWTYQRSLIERLMFFVACSFACLNFLGRGDKTFPHKNILFVGPQIALSTLCPLQLDLSNYTGTVTSLCFGTTTDLNLETHSDFCLCYARVWFLPPEQRLAFKLWCLRFVREQSLQVRIWCNWWSASSVGAFTREEFRPNTDCFEVPSSQYLLQNEVT